MLARQNLETQYFFVVAGFHFVGPQNPKPLSTLRLYPQTPKGFARTTKVGPLGQRPFPGKKAAPPIKIRSHWISHESLK